MRILLATTAILSSLALAPQDAAAQARRGEQQVETTGSLGERAPWNQPWEYDSGSDNDRRPELPYYQQGRGQQTGGTARNLLPYDGFTLTPR